MIHLKYKIQNTVQLLQWPLEKSIEGEPYYE